VLAEAQGVDLVHEVAGLLDCPALAMDTHSTSKRTETLVQHGSISAFFCRRYAERLLRAIRPSRRSLHVYRGARPGVEGSRVLLYEGGPAVNLVTLRGRGLGVSVIELG